LRIELPQTGDASMRQRGTSGVLVVFFQPACAKDGPHFNMLRLFLDPPEAGKLQGTSEITAYEGLNWAFQPCFWGRQTFVLHILRK